MTTTPREVLDPYRALALEWAALRDDPKKANRAFRKHHAYYKEIRDLPDGRRALLTLLGDAEVPVRLLAATHALPFAAADAEPILVALESSDDIYAMDAKNTLLSFREGRLSLDW